MATSILTSSGINSLVSAYKSSQTSRLVYPLQTIQNKYKNISSAYSSLSSSLDSFVSSLSDFTATDSSSVFAAMKANSSNSNFVTATTSNSAAVGNYELRVEQMAKSDIAVSQNLDSNTANSITGTHEFQITTGSPNGDLTSNISVTFSAGETNQTVMQKISDAINSNQAVASSQSEVAANSYSGGASSLTFDVGGTTTTVSVNSGGSGSQTYDQLLNELVQNINTNVSDVTAQKITDPNNSANEMLQITANDSSKSISISDSSGTLASDLGITTSNLIGASGIVTASAFSPASNSSQLSITSKNTGLDYIIKNISDTTGSSALSSIGMNLGASRPTFDQTTSPNTAGYVYADTTLSGNQLNAKINFNGLDIQKDSNTISDLVSGVTFNLKSVMQATDSTANVSVGSDTDTITSNIKDFISSFNSVYSYIKTNTAVSKDTGRSVLSGDSNAFSIMNTMTSTVLSSVSGLSQSALNRLSSIGISFDSTSGLSLSDSTVLKDKLTNNLSQVSDIFNSTNGIAVKLYDSLNPYVGADGYLTLAKSSMDENVKNYTDRITSAQSRITKSSDSLRLQYQKLQAQLVSLTDTAQTFFGVSLTNYFGQ